MSSQKHTQTDRTDSITSTADTGRDSLFWTHPEQQGCWLILESISCSSSNSCTTRNVGFPIPGKGHNIYRASWMKGEWGSMGIKFSPIHPWSDEWGWMISLFYPSMNNILVLQFIAIYPHSSDQGWMGENLILLIFLCICYSQLTVQKSM